MIEEAKRLLNVKGNMDAALAFAEEKAEGYYSKGEMMKAFRWLDIKEALTCLDQTETPETAATQIRTDQHQSADGQKLAA